MYFNGLVFFEMSHLLLTNLRLPSTTCKNKIVSEPLLTNHMIFIHENWIICFCNAIIVLSLLFLKFSHINLRVSQDTSRFWSKKDFFLVDEDNVRDYSNKLDIHSGPDGTHSQVLASVIETTLNYLWKVTATGVDH